MTISPDEPPPRPEEEIADAVTAGASDPVAASDGRPDPAGGAPSGEPAQGEGEPDSH